MVSTISQGSEHERQTRDGQAPPIRQGQPGPNGIPASDGTPGSAGTPGGDGTAGYNGTPGGSDGPAGNDGTPTQRCTHAAKKQGGLTAMFERFAAAITARAGSPAAFCLALSLVVIWALSGPLFGFSEKWQLVINSGTTIVTFLMVFLIQQSQNKDSQAVHLKLDELLKLQSDSGNEMIDIEDLTEEQIKHLAAQFKRKGVSD